MSKKRRRSRAVADGVVVLLGVAAAFVAAGFLDLFERFAELSRAHEAWELDEFVIGGAVAALALLVYSIRRASELRRGFIELEETRARLLESERRFRQLAENINQVFWLTDWKQRELLYVSPSYETIFRQSTQSLYHDRKSWSHNIHPEERANVVESFAQAAERGEFVEKEYRIILEDGSLHWVRDRAFPIHDAAGEVIRVVGLAEDVTDQKRAEEALRESEQRYRRLIENAPDGFARDITDRKRTENELLLYQDRMRTLASEASLAEERERRRIAANLHDGPVQSLALLRLKLEQLPAATDPSSAVAEMRALVKQTTEEVRSVLSELSPPALYELGIVAAAESLAEQLGERHGIRCQVRDDHQPAPLTEDVSLVLFQALRELLLNVSKHAKATRVEVDFHREGDRLAVRVEDDGVGFETGPTKAFACPTGGFGLLSIRERLHLLGGRLEIDANPGQGTRVTITAPLNPEEAECMTRQIGILIADDHAVVRAGLRKLLQSEPDMEVLAEANNGVATVRLATKLHPDVVIMDVSMPDMNGIEATRRIIAEAPKIKVLALSMHADNRFVARMFHAGSSGYVSKECAFREIALAIRTVFANEVYLSPNTAHKSEH